MIFVAVFFVGVLFGYILWREKIVLGGRYAELREKFIELEVIRRNDIELINSYKSQLENLEGVVGKAFKSMSLEVFKENAQEFMKLANEGAQQYSNQANESLQSQRLMLEKTIEPLKTNLQLFEQKIESLEKSRSNAYVGLKEHIEQLNQMQLRLESKTEELARSFKDPNTRGRWGELQLRRAVEFAGMIEHVDFDLQHQLNNGSLRPDMIIHLPNNRVVVVDAKSPKFEQYIEVINSDNKDEEEKALKACCQRIREVVSKLGGKAYCASLENAPDFVVLFFPGEWLFSRILNADPNIIEYATKNNVVFSTPTTLISLLKAINYGWKQNEMVKEVQEIGKLGGELYDKLTTFGDHFHDLRKSIKKIIDVYNSIQSSVESKILPCAEKLSVFSKKNNTLSALSQKLDDI